MIDGAGGVRREWKITVVVTLPPPISTPNDS
jgi:hypothetical protein